MREVQVEINDMPYTILILDDCHVSTERVLQEVKVANMLGAFGKGEEDDD